MAEPVTEIVIESDLVLARVIIPTLDEETVRQALTEIRAAIDANPQSAVILDLSRVTFIPSLSLGALVRLASDARTKKQRLILAGLAPDVRQVFLYTRLDRVFEMQASVAAATRSIRPV